MTDRILKNWNIRRVLYTAMGIYMVASSIPSLHWFGIGIGTYFAAMGIFSFGCAGGNCYGGSCTIDEKKA
jgi:hypothetical protein